MPRAIYSVTYFFSVQSSCCWLRCLLESFFGAGGPQLPDHVNLAAFEIGARMKRLFLVCLVAISARAEDQPCATVKAQDNVRIFTFTALTSDQCAQILAVLNTITRDRVDLGALATQAARLPKGATPRRIEFTELQRNNLLKLAKMDPGAKSP